MEPTNRTVKTFLTNHTSEGFNLRIARHGKPFRCKAGWNRVAQPHHVLLAIKPDKDTSVEPNTSWQPNKSSKASKSLPLPFVR
jgi:hypothetical protein